MTGPWGTPVPSCLPPGETSGQLCKHRDNTRPQGDTWRKYTKSFPTEWLQGCSGFDGEQGMSHSGTCLADRFSRLITPKRKETFVYMKDCHCERSLSLG